MLGAHITDNLLPRVPITASRVPLRDTVTTNPVAYINSLGPIAPIPIMWISKKVCISPSIAVYPIDVKYLADDVPDIELVPRGTEMCTCWTLGHEIHSQVKLPHLASLGRNTRRDFSEFQSIGVTPFEDIGPIGPQEHHLESATTSPGIIGILTFLSTTLALSSFLSSFFYAFMGHFFLYIYPELMTSMSNKFESGLYFDGRLHNLHSGPYWPCCSSSHWLGRWWGLCEVLASVVSYVSGEGCGLYIWSHERPISPEGRNRRGTTLREVGIYKWVSSFSFNASMELLWRTITP